MTHRGMPFDLSCAEAQENLSAMLDGEITMDEEAAVRRHIETCAGCRSYERDLLMLAGKIAAEPDRPGDGAAAWVRAKVEIESEHRRNANRRDGPVWTLPKRWALAATILLALMLGGWQMLGKSPDSGAITAETTRDFQVFQASGEVLDIAATHPDAVHTWMTARLDFMLPGQLRAPEGVRIAGGRLCSLLGRKLAFIAYSVSGQDVGLYVAKADGLDLPKDGTTRILKSEDGLSAIGWRTGDLAYVVVSELPAAALADFSRYFQRASRES